jgi:hypothetical protein
VFQAPTPPATRDIAVQRTPHLPPVAPHPAPDTIQPTQPSGRADVNKKIHKNTKMNFKNRKGVAALITVLSLGILVFIISLSSVILAFWSIKNVGAGFSGLKTYYASYSGVQDALIKLERNKDYTSTGFNLSINGTNDVSIVVSFDSNQATIISTSTLSQINKKLQTVVDINSTTGLITPTSTVEQTL